MAFVKQALDPGDEIDGPSAVICIPRQFLMPAPSKSLDEMFKIGVGCYQQSINGVLRGEDSHGDLVFFSRDLMNAIERSFSSDEIARNYLAFEHQRFLLEHRFPDVVRASDHRAWSSDESGHVRRAWSPYFYFSADDISNIDSDVMRSRWKDHAGCDVSDHPTPDLGPQGYDPERVLLRIYRNLDADFLLRHIDDADWQRIAPLTEAWSNEIGRVVMSELWAADGRFKKKKVVSLLKSARRDEADKDWDQVASMVLKALGSFQNGSARVLRHAVENAQRLVLAGFPPYALVVRTKDEIMGAWWSYLKKYLNGRLIDWMVSRPSVIGFDELPEDERLKLGLESARKRPSAE